MTERIHWAPIALGERGILREGRFRWLRAAAWMIALFFIVLATFGVAMEAIEHLLPKDDPRLRFLARCVSAAVTLGVYALLVRLGEMRSPREIAVGPAVIETLAGLAIGAAMFALVMAMLTGFGWYDIAVVGPAPAWRAAGLAIQAGVVEELAIRGVMLRLLWRAWGPLPAFALSAAMFGVGHLANADSSLFAVVCIALEAGVMLGAFYALTGRLWVSVGVHAAWNFTQGYVFGAAVSGGDLGPAMAHSTARSGLPEWLTGGAFGPEASLPALVVCTTVGIATLWMARKAGRFSSEATTDVTASGGKAAHAA